MSLARVAVDVGQIVLNQWATAPPHKAPQEGRFKTKGESVFGFAPVIFWVSVRYAECRASFVADIIPSAPAAVALPYLRPRIFDHHPLPHSPNPTRFAQAHFVPLLPFFLTYGRNTLPLRHTDHVVRDPPDGLWNFCSPPMLQSPRSALYLRPLHQTRAPTGHLRPVQLCPTSRLPRFAVSHGRSYVRGIDSRKLDHRVRGWVAPSRRDVHYAVRMDFVVGLYHRGWIHKSHSGGRTNEEQVRRRVGTLRDESQVLVCSRPCVGDRESLGTRMAAIFSFLVHTVAVLRLDGLVYS